MKKFVAMIVLACAMMVFASGFCDGWEDGYKAGYCYQNYTCMAPMTPMCPMQRIGESTYQDGYNRGFMRGLGDRR
jgi:hypothetical protein